MENFKKEIRKKRSLRKCSRNFLRYCDEDDNGKISMEEWVDCTDNTGNIQNTGFTGNTKNKDNIQVILDTGNTGNI